MLAGKIIYRNHQWLARLSHELAGKSIVDGSRRSAVKIFVRQSRIQEFKRLIGDVGEDLQVDPLEQVASPWQWTWGEGSTGEGGAARCGS